MDSPQDSSFLCAIPSQQTLENSNDMISEKYCGLLKALKERSSIFLECVNSSPEENYAKSQTYPKKSLFHMINLVKAADNNHQQARNILISYGSDICVNSEDDQVILIMYYQINVSSSFSGSYLAYEYNDGKYIDKDIRKAKILFKRTTNVPLSLSFLGLIYFSNKKHQKGLSFVNKGIELGCPRAMIILGLIYWKGSGVEKDLNKSEECYRKAIDMGYYSALVVLGIFYGENDRFDEAMQSFDLAIEHGHYGGLLDQAYLYNSHGDYEKAVKCCRLAIEKKIKDAHIDLIHIHMINEKFQSAIELLEPEIEKGDKHAITIMGLIYTKKEYSGYDYTKAIYYFEMAKNFPLALLNLTNAYILGNGVIKNSDKAWELIQQIFIQDDLHLLSDDHIQDTLGRLFTFFPYKYDIVATKYFVSIGKTFYIESLCRPELIDFMVGHCEMEKEFLHLQKEHKHLKKEHETATNHIKYSDDGKAFLDVLSSWNEKILREKINKINQ